MKTTTHDSLLSLLLHQQGRLLDSSLGSIALPREHGSLLIVSRKLASDGIKVTPEAISLHPEGGEKLATFAAALLSRNPPDLPMPMLIESVRKENLRQAISQACQKYHDMANDETQEPSDALLEMHGDITKLASERANTVFEHGSKMDGVEERLSWRQAHTGMLRGPSTGFRKLDRMMNGLTPRYYLIGARPSVGKSSIAGNLIESLCQDGLRVALFSWEMPADDCRERQLASLSQVNLTAFADRPLTIEELERISRAQRVMKGWDWHINDDPDTTIDDVEAQAMCLHKEKPLDMIAIDYIQLIRTVQRMKPLERVSEISNRLARLRRRLKTTAIVALSQLRRVEGRFVKELDRTMMPKPEISDLRESGELEQDADVIWLLHRDLRNEPDNAELIIGKHRGGRTGEIRLRFDGETTKFTEAR